MNKEIELKPCREAFEARYQRDITHQREDEGYRNQFIQQDWEGFRAAWEHKTVIEAQLQAENERLRSALEVGFWTAEEKDGLLAAFKNNKDKCGTYETLFAVAAFILRHRAKAALQHNEVTK